MAKKTFGTLFGREDNKGLLRVTAKTHCLQLLAKAARHQSSKACRPLAAAMDLQPALMVHVQSFQRMGSQQMANPRRILARLACLKAVQLALQSPTTSSTRARATLIQTKMRKFRRS